MGEIKPLTAMRGLFAMWVVFFHIAMWAPHARIWLPIVSRGYIAVDFFFILSGFILARAHADQFPVYRFSEHLRFILKRFIRLFPLHWAILTTLLVAMAINGAPLYWKGYIIDEALLIHRWGFSHSPRAVINGPDWSISTEWAANLLYPTFVWLILGNRIKAIFVTFLAVGAIFYVANYNSWSLDFSFARSFIPLMRCFAEFAIGIAVYRARKYAPRLSPDWVVGTLLFVDLVLLEIRWTDIVVAATMPFLILGLSDSNGRIASLLESKPLHWLGTVSYSIYLIQYPIILLSLWILPSIDNIIVRNLIFSFLSVFLILVISHFTHIFIELGARRIFGMRAESRSKRSLAATVSP